jgi:hypothetical protein
VAAVARRIDYQPQLGAPWFAIVSYPVYYPWRPFEWWYAFDAYAPDLFNEAGAIAAAGGVTGIIVAVIGSLWRARQNRLVTTAARPAGRPAGRWKRHACSIPPASFSAGWELTTCGTTEPRAPPFPFQPSGMTPS